jgi:cytochrome bd-type quinol oxidase subunit 1
MSLDSTVLQGAFIASLFLLLHMLVLGLAFLLALMETLWVITGRPVYHDMTRYWGQPFAILFGLMLASLIALVVQLGTHWSPFAHIAGEPFAIAWVVALLGGFMPAAILFALFQQGWTRLTRSEHLTVTWGLALTVSIALLAEMAAWNLLQDPSAARMHSGTLRLQLTDLAQLFGEQAQMRFLHLTGAAYVWVALTMMAVSAHWLLQGRDLAFARRSFALSAGFGLAAVLAVLVVRMTDLYPFVSDAEVLSYSAFAEARALAQELPQGQDGTTIALPDTRLLYAFRIMTGSGFVLLLLFVAAFLFCHRRQAWERRWLLRIIAWSWPLPLLTIAAGWVFSEAGRSPWMITGILPFEAAQTVLPVSSASFSLAAYLMFLGLPTVLGLLLIGRMFRQGPSLLATGRYHFEVGIQTSWLETKSR